MTITESIVAFAEAMDRHRKEMEEIVGNFVRGRGELEERLATAERKLAEAKSIIDEIAGSSTTAAMLAEHASVVQAACAVVSVWEHADRVIPAQGVRDTLQLIRSVEAYRAAGGKL